MEQNYILRTSNYSNVDYSKGTIMYASINLTFGDVSCNRNLTVAFKWYGMYHRAGVVINNP